MIQTIHCAWMIRCGEPPKADQKLTIANGVLQEVIPVPADERSLIRPVAVLPGLVNAHTHLEFSKLTSPLSPPSPFPDWIRSVVRYRHQCLSDDAAILDAVATGMKECEAHGTSIVGEICTSKTGLDAIRQLIRSDRENTTVCFRELIGFPASRVADLKAETDHFVLSFAGGSSELKDVQPGLSPHAPYSVHPDVVSYACHTAAQKKLPIAMHLAETRDELNFVESRAGRFVEFLDELGLWQPNTLEGISSIADYLTMLRECQNVLAVHGNYFGSNEIRLLGEAPNIATVYCVRTHEWFRHPQHPWQKIEAAGGSVILGTDSRASNADLSIWRELQRFCELYPRESFLKRLAMISTDAAAALGMAPAEVNLSIGHRFRACEVDVRAQTETAVEACLMRASSVSNAGESSASVS